MSSVLSIFMLFTEIFYSAFAVGGNVLLEQEKLQQKLADMKPWEVIHWSPSQAQLYENDFLVVSLRLQTEMDFALYADKLEFYPPSGMKLAKVTAPKTVRKKDPLSYGEVDVYTGGDFELVFEPADRSTSASDKSPKANFAVRYLGCTAGICLLPHTFEMNANVTKVSKAYTFQISSAETSNLDANNSQANSENSGFQEVSRDASNGVKEINDQHNQVGSSPMFGEPTQIEIRTPDKNLETKIADILKGNIPFWMILCLLFIGGVLTNLTPCVYPMIPITIRVLSHQSSSTVLASVLYGSGILLTYTALGIVASYSGILFGSFMASPTLNLVLAFIMIVLAFTMLGFGNFSWLQTIGNRISGKGKGPRTAFYMGLGAGLVASPCTGPILASLLTVTSTRHNVFEASLLLGTYSLGFALPYIFLGVLSNKIAKKRFSPRVQVAVKTIFAGAIFSVAFIYIKIPLQSVWHAILPNLQTIVQISGYLASVLILLVLISRDLFERKVLLIIPSFVCGIALFSAFELKFSQNPSRSLTWLKSEDQAFQLAETENRPILIDAWAEWCVACKKMEIETFADSKVVQEINSGKWILLKLDLTESTDLTDEIQTRYGIQSLPTLVIIPAGGKSKFDDRKLLVGYQDVASLLDALRVQR